MYVNYKKKDNFTRFCLWNEKQRILTFFDRSHGIVPFYVNLEVKEEKSPSTWKSSGRGTKTRTKAHVNFVVDCTACIRERYFENILRRRYMNSLHAALRVSDFSIHATAIPIHFFFTIQMNEWKWFKCIIDTVFINYFTKYIAISVFLIIPFWHFNVMSFIIIYKRKKQLFSNDSRNSTKGIFW